MTKQGLAITTTGKANLKVLRDWHNSVLGTQYKTITQFRKHYDQPDNSTTEQLLAEIYNNDLADRKAKQMIKDKTNKNQQITELKDKSKALRDKGRDVFIQEITINFLKRDKDTQDPFIKGTYAFNVFANTQSGLKQKADGNFAIRKTKPYEAKGIGYIQLAINKLLQDSPTEIKIINWVYGKVYSNGNQVQINRIRMREEEAFMLDDEEKPAWDTGNGKCVYNAIISAYGKSKGMIKKMTEEYLTSVFKKYDYDEQEHQNPLVDGVCLEQIQGFCREENISCYAFDIRDNLITKHLYDKTRGQNTHKAFVFRMYNKHIYPITDDTKRKSLIERQKDDHKQSSIVKLQEKKAKEGEEEHEKKVYEVVKNDSEYEGNEYATNMIFESGRVPYPFTSEKIKYDNGNIKSFKIGNQLFMTEKTNPVIEEYFRSIDRIYQGENEMSLLYEFYKQCYGNTFNNNDLVSNFSPYLLTELTKENVKYRTHYGNCSEYDADTITSAIADGSAIGADITKCYSSILDEPAEDWIIYDILDCVEPCEIIGGVVLGLYFVETEDFTLFHGSNWYSSAIINYANGFNIEFKITHKVIPRKKYANKEYFKKYIDYTINELGYDSKGKQKVVKSILNALTGLLGRTHSTSYDTNITTDINEVWNGIDKKLNRIDDLFIKNISKDGKDLHIWGLKNKKELLTNNLPIYIQILDQSNIKIHQLACAMGGEIVFRKTDMIVSLGGTMPTNESITRFDWGGYIKETDLTKYTYDYKMYKVRAVMTPVVLSYDADEYADTLTSSNQYKEILDYAVKRGGMLITARAGTGKSYMFNKWIADGLIEDDPKTRLAFTNCAKKNIGGTTIHTALGITEDNEKCSQLNIASYRDKKVILVDEIGMIGKDLWKFLLLIKQKYNPVFILAGDYRQVQPIENEDNYDYFTSQVVRYLCDGTRIELLERQRYDKVMWDWLENFYEESIIGKELLFTKEINPDAKHLCYYNKTRCFINDMMMDYHKSKDAVRLEHKQKNKDDRARTIWLYKGLPVMSIKNNKKYDTINSDVFVVESYDEDIITLQDLNDDERKIEVGLLDFHSIFVANYASTIHKVQGSTITTDINIWDYGKVFGDKHLGYTAVSRAKDINQIRVLQTEN